MDLATSELRVLQALRDSKRVGELAEAVERSDSYTSQVAHNLEKKGLVRIERDGKNKIVSTTEDTSIQRFHDLTQEYGHIDWPELLGGKALDAVYYLDGPITIRDIADRTDNYRNTVYRELKPLLDRGIVQKDDGRYMVNDEFQEVIRFVHAVVRHGHRQTMKQYTSQFRILWTSPHTFLVETGDRIEAPPFHTTGPQRLQQYGDIDLLAREKHYYLYDGKAEAVSAEELVCHLMLIDRKARFLTYTLLLIVTENLNQEAVTPFATKYNVQEIVTQLYTYLEQEGKGVSRRFPTWHEFKETAAKYGVTV